MYLNMFLNRMYQDSGELGKKTWKKFQFNNNFFSYKFIVYT